MCAVESTHTAPAREKKKAALGETAFSKIESLTSESYPAILPAMQSRKQNHSRPSKRYGASELFGRALLDITSKELRTLSSIDNRAIPCPFKPDRAACHKKGGVCSLGLYDRSSDGNITISNLPVTTCPSRFLENSVVFKWVSKTLLDTDETTIVNEVSFLMSNHGRETDEDEVGRIDSVLVRQDKDRLHWCALEMQAVYFSGGKMADDFALMRKWNKSGLPFPAKQRRPDFRSSGPKRLMPQLQIKVPTLRRWGKKMAVVVDNAFWKSLGVMQRTPHISNADIVWFVVDYEGPIKGQYKLQPHEAVFTTLEHAVECLTGGMPVSLEQFERAIRAKIERGEAR